MKILVTATLDEAAAMKRNSFRAITDHEALRAEEIGRVGQGRLRGRIALRSCGRSSPPRTDHARQDFQIKLISQQQGNENLPGYGGYVGLL
jgi:hypothetical protein